MRHRQKWLLALCGITLFSAVIVYSQQGWPVRNSVGPDPTTPPEQYPSASTPLRGTDLLTLEQDRGGGAYSRQKLTIADLKASIETNVFSDLTAKSNLTLNYATPSTLAGFGADKQLQTYVTTGSGSAVLSNAPTIYGATLSGGATVSGSIISSTGTPITGDVADTVARLALTPTYGLSTSYTWGGGYGSSTVLSSTFSGWGFGVGTNSAAFSAVRFRVYPFNASAIPTTLIIRLRIVPSGVLPFPSGVGQSGATNPAAWTIVAQVTNSVSLAYGTMNSVTTIFPQMATTTTNLWFEVVGNGTFGLAQTSPLLNPDYNVIPSSAYLTGSSLSATNWNSVAASPQSYTSTIEFGTISQLSGFTPTPALLSALGLTNAAVFSLPPTNYAVSGTEFNLYWRGIVRSTKPVEDLWFDATCTKGTQYQNFFRTLPVDADAGTFALTLTAADTTNTLSTYSGQLKIASDAAGSGVTRKLLVIGDSTTAGGQVVTELNQISGTNGFKLDTIGTQGTSTNKHEGRGGWTAAMFYSGNGSPFTNGVGAFSFNYYLTNNSLTMASNDWVFINLGINDVFGQTSDSGALSVASSFLATCSNMVTSIRSTVPGIRVGLCVTIPPSYSQDPFGVNYANGQTFYRYNRNRAILAEAIAAYSQTGVYIVPIAAGLDTVNNMLTTTGVLNSRNTNTWTYLSNGVHPATIGYYQIADQMWAFLKCMEN